MQSLGECQQQYNLVVRCLALHSKWIFFLLWGIEQPASALLWIFTSQEDVSVGRQVWLHTCLCVCVGARTHSPDCLCWQQTAVRSVFQTHVQPLLKQLSRPKSQCSECVSVFCVTVLTYLWSAPQQQKQALSPSSSPPPLCATSPIQACDSSCFSASWVNNTTARTCSTCLHLRPESNTLCTWHQNVAE